MDHKLIDYFKFEDFKDNISEEIDKDGRVKMGFTCICGKYAYKSGDSSGSYTKEVELGAVKFKISQHAMRCKDYLELLEYRKELDENPEFAAQEERKTLERIKNMKKE